MIEINKDINEILYLGPEGTYCEIAKNQFISLIPSSDLKQTTFSTVKSIIEYVDKNEHAAGIIPIENSIEGIVR